MTPDLFVTLGGSGAALTVLLFWIRSIAKDRDWYRDRYEENNKALRVAVEELEQRPRPSNGPKLKVVK